MGAGASIYRIKNGQILTSDFAFEEEIPNESLLFGDVYPNLSVLPNSDIYLTLITDSETLEEIFVKIPNNFTYLQFKTLFLNATGNEFMGEGGSANPLITFYDYADVNTVTSSRTVHIWWTIGLSLGAILASMYSNVKQFQLICTLLVIVAVFIGTVQNKSSASSITIPTSVNWESIQGGTFYMRARTN